MNINELSEKNIHDAVALYKDATKDYLHFIYGADVTEEDIASMLTASEDMGDFTYLFYDRGVLLAMVTIAKSKAEIKNMFVKFDVIDEFFTTKFLEFAIKQFSAITRVFVWVSSIDTKLSNMLEDYGFEYTGEQEYISKEYNILQFKYVFKRECGCGCRSGDCIARGDTCC